MKLLDRLYLYVVAVLFLCTPSEVFAQRVIETTEAIVAPEGEVATRNETGVQYWLLLDTSGSMTADRVARAQQTVREVQSALRPGVDSLSVFGFPVSRFARCTPASELSPFTGLPRPVEGGERPLRPISIAEVEAMTAGRGQSRTTPLWPAVAELLHDLREVMASGTNRRHRLLVVTDRGCDSRHCTRRNPTPDLDSLRCPITEDEISALLPQMASEQLLGSGVNQIAWTLVDQAGDEAPASQLCGRGVDCADDNVERSSLIPPWRFEEISVSLPEDSTFGLASRRIDMSFSWQIVERGLDEIKATAGIVESPNATVQAGSASRFIGLDTPAPVTLVLPVAIDPRATDHPRPPEMSWQTELVFGEGDGPNRADQPRRSFEIALPTEYVVVPLRASTTRPVEVPVGSHVAVDVTDDIAPLTELLGVENVRDVAARLEVGAVAYGSQVGDIRLVPSINADALANGRMVIDLSVESGTADEVAWRVDALEAAERAVTDSPTMVAVVLRDRNGWFQFSPLSIAKFVCVSPCDAAATCAAQCDSRCCTAGPPPPADLSWIWWLLVLLLAAIAVWIWSRRFPDPRGLRLEFEASTGPRSVRLFKEYNPWKQPLNVIPPEATETEFELRVRCHRNGEVELRLNPVSAVRAGTKVEGTSVVIAKITRTERKHAPSITLIAVDKELLLIDQESDRS
jgi:hypothetical protein